MRKVQLTFASLALCAVLAFAAVVAFAAPASVRQAASPTASAAADVYCPRGEKRRRQNAVKTAQRRLRTFNRQMLRTRKLYFRTHRGAAARARYVKRQKAQQKALKARIKAAQRRLRRCN